MIFTDEFMNPLFRELELCQGVQQMEEHHPEGDVFNHSLQALYRAFRETIDTDLILAAMLHDIGKRENSLGHEKIAVEKLSNCLSVKSLWLIENHMRIWYYILGDMKKLSKVKELAEHPWLSELIQLARFDKLGRNPNRKIIYNKNDIVERLNNCVDKKFQEARNKYEHLHMQKNTLQKPERSTCSNQTAQTI